MAKKEKEFNFKLYAVSVFVVICALLVIITTTTFKSRYTAFHPEEVAKNYVATIIETGDGYNAYKNTVVSKNGKYGDFIRKYYMYPVIYRGESDYTAEKGTDGLKGFNDDSYKGEKTLSDDGSLQGKLIAEMYPYYEKLIKKDGWDNYDKIFTKYFDKLVKVRKDIFEDDYISDEVMFTALEANVKTYGETLTGTEDVFDENTGIQTSFKSVGKYQNAFGEDYKFTVEYKSVTDLDLDAYKENYEEEAFAAYGVTADDISFVKEYGVEVYCGDKKVASTDVVTVRIGKSWYVDNTQTVTKELYNFYR